jgi:hypothetical protein
MNNNECSICFSKIEDDNNMTITECNHKFHSKCLMDSLAHGMYNCPLCRFELTKKIQNESEEYEDEYDEEFSGIYSDDDDDDEDDNVTSEEHYRNDNGTLYSDYALRGLRFFTSRIEEIQPEIKDTIDEKNTYSFDYYDDRLVPCNHTKYSNYSLRGLRFLTNSLNGTENTQEDITLEKLQDIPEPINISKSLQEKNVSYEDLVNCILYNNFEGYCIINRTITSKSQKNVHKKINTLIAEHKQLC